MSLPIEAVGQFDVVIATAWQTAAHVARLEHGRKYYFIQHFEDWDADAESILSSWRLPLLKIVISRWLQDMVETLGEKSFQVPNAIDGTFFRAMLPIETREPSSVLVQLHPKVWKGSQDALDALKILRARGRDFQLDLFGMGSPSSFEIPGPYRFHPNPSQATLRSLYSRNAVFVAASWAEGWGLTPHEAAACGCAIVATDIGGHREFLDHEVSALLSEPKNPENLADNIERLLADQLLRTELARAGQKVATTFTWDKAAPLFERTLYKTADDLHQSAG